MGRAGTFPASAYQPPSGLYNSKTFRADTEIRPYELTNTLLS